MVRARSAPALLASSLLLFSASALAAAPPAPPAADAGGDLRSPEQRDTRQTAYTLPRGTWGLDVGALGVGGGDVFARLGVAYGLGAGVELELNLAHAGVGLINVAAHWHFIDTRYFDLGMGLGVWYGHGDWFWIVQGLSKEVVSKLDVLNVPVSLTASMPVLPSLQLDFGVEYTYAEVFGTIDRERSIFQEANLGVRQLTFNPGAHWFMSSNTSLGLNARLAAYTGVPVAGERNGSEHQDYRKVPFSETWSLEAALRSRLRPGLFANLRMHYGEIARALYGAVIYPSFEVEVRF